MTSIISCFVFILISDTINVILLLEAHEPITNYQETTILAFLPFGSAPVFTLNVLIENTLL